MVALFVFVKPLYYTQSCLASIFYTAGVLLIQQDNHVGSALFACAIAAGHLIAGILLAGLMVRICRPRRPAYTCDIGLFIWRASGRWLDGANLGAFGLGI